MEGTDYLIGFGTFTNDGATFSFNTSSNTTTSSNESSDTERYLMPELTVCVAERKEIAGRTAYEVISGVDAPISINVTRMELRHFDGSDIFSFSNDKNASPVLVKTSDFVTTQSILGEDRQIPNSAYYYFTRGEAGKVAIVATVDVTMGEETTTVEVGMTFEVILTNEVEWSRTAEDTVEYINNFLAGRQIGSDTVYKLYLDRNAVYEGTILIPDDWDLNNKNSRLEIFGNGAKVTGGIDLGGEDVFRIQDINFEKADGYTDAAVRNGAASLWSCTFIGYDTAVDSTKGLIIPRVANIFVANTTAWKLDLTPEGGIFGGTSEMQNNTFVLNNTAVHIFGTAGQSTLPLYYFRIFNSNFIGNDTDFKIDYAGNFYMQQNFFGKPVANINKNDVAAAKAFAESLRLANTQQSLNDLVERRKAKLSGQADTFVDPCWGLPVFTVGRVDFSFDAYDYGNYLTIDGKENQEDKHTRIKNEWADSLIVDDSAFGNDNITIDVADGQENVVGIWNFGE